MFLFNFGNIQRHIIVAPHFTECLLLVMMTIIMIIVMMTIIIIIIMMMIITIIAPAGLLAPEGQKPEEAP